LALPLLSARAVGDGGPTQEAGRNDLLMAAPSPSAAPPHAAPRSTTPSAPRPVITPAPRSVITPAAPPKPLPAVQPPTAPSGFCPDALSIHVVAPELMGAVQAGVDLLTPYFGCQKFRIDGTGLPVKFGPVTPLLNARGLGY